MDQAAALLALLRNGNGVFGQQQQQPAFNIPPTSNINQILLMQCLQNPALTADPSVTNALLSFVKQQHSQQNESQSSPAQQKRPIKQEAIKQEVQPFSPSQLSALKLNMDNAHLVAAPLSSTTSVDEGIMTSSPTETASGSEVDEHDLHSELPKETENSTRKRPAAIQDMLLKNKKKARLDNLMNGLFQKKKETDEVDAAAEKKPSRPNSTPNQQTDSSNWGETFGHILSKENDDKTTLTGRTCKSEEPTYPSSLASFMAITSNNEEHEDSATSVSLNDSMMKKSEDLEQIPEDWKPTFNEVYEGPDAKYIPPERVFAQVPGRLSLLSNVVKYKMTVAEVRRRLLGPEAFNFSLLGALLRRAKMPEKSRLLLAELREIGLAIPRGRRRAEKVTLLSALTEAEAEQLCVDFGVVSDNHFPIREFATLSLERAAERDQLQHRLVELHGSRNMIDDYIRWLEMDRSEIRDKKPTPVLPTHLQDPLSTYSMLTHGFGTSGLLVGVRVFRKFISEQITLIEAQMKAIK